METMAWQWTMLAMTSTWIADSGAYFVGKFLAGNILGKHHLSPRLSPNKTVEGYAGGIFLGTAFTVALAYFMELPLVGALILGLLVSIVSPMGDLGISLLKREAGVKDSGTIFRGHGGALDRVDSLIWSIAMAYYLVLFIERLGI
jgi:phosphatidate cytidylyltransferase